MHNINTATATAEHEFTDGNAASGIPATDLNAAWFNTVQRELSNVVTGTGYTLNESKDNQILSALMSHGLNVAINANNKTVDATKWSGSTVIVDVTNNGVCPIAGTFKGNVFIIAMSALASKSTGAQDSTITYNGHEYKIKSGCVLLAHATNECFNIACNLMILPAETVGVG